MTMTRARAALLLAGVFLLGMVCGALGAGAYLRHSFSGQGRHGFGDRGPKHERIVRRIAHKLDLDAEQRKALEAAVARSHEELARIRAEALPRIEAVIDRAFDDLEPHLRPDQLERLEEVRTRTRERLRRHHPPAPHPLPPPGAEREPPPPGPAPPPPSGTKPEPSPLGFPP